ncbi:MAG: hypothetical protein LBL01_08030 [Bifidobacteriaceae bacterium]|jgi:hypothetical protein|nr:hypothetical protein [Bifidobacteriaceae bacterium]
MNPVLDETRKARITVEVFEDDYRALRMAAAAGPRGTSVSRLVRQVLHEWLEQAEDAADLDLAERRLAEEREDVPGVEVRAWLAARRAARAE